MQWHWWTLATCLAATGARAGIAKLMAEGVRGNEQASQNRLQELAKVQIAARGVGSLLPRQATAMARPTNGSASAPLAVNPDGTVDVKAWDANVKAACTDAISVLPQSTNPSGVCVCYNLPVLNNKTGQFEADLRLFHLNSATGPFAGIAPQNVQVSLVYNGASVTALHNLTGKTNVVAVRQAANPANALAPVPIAGGRDLRQIQQYLFIGQVDMAKLAYPVSTGQLQAVVTPTVTLSAVTPANQVVRTNVSTNEATFLVGVFSDTAVFSDETLAIMAIDRVVADLRSANGTTAFVLPGLSILIEPIGLVITGVWLIIGLAVIGFGTIERIKYAESFKKRMQRANKGNVERI